MKALALLCLAISLPAHALIPKTNLSAKVQSEQVAVEQAFASELGIQLSNEQKQELTRVLIQQGEPELMTASIEDRGTLDKSRKIVCIGYAYGAGAVMGEAGCVAVLPFQTYSIAFIGVGYQLALEGRLFGLSIRYNSKRYSSSFDPVPGDYGLGTYGLTLGAGFTRFVGDSGNKSVSELLARRECRRDQLLKNLLSTNC